MRPPGCVVVVVPVPPIPATTPAQSVHGARDRPVTAPVADVTVDGSDDGRLVRVLGSDDRAGRFRKTTDGRTDGMDDVVGQGGNGGRRRGDRQGSGAERFVPGTAGSVRDPEGSGRAPRDGRSGRTDRRRSRRPVRGTTRDARCRPGAPAGPGVVPGVPVRAGAAETTGAVVAAVVRPAFDVAAADTRVHEAAVPIPMTRAPVAAAIEQSASPTGRHRTAGAGRRSRRGARGQKGAGTCAGEQAVPPGRRPGPRDRPATRTPASGPGETRRRRVSMAATPDALVLGDALVRPAVTTLAELEHPLVAVRQVAVRLRDHPRVDLVGVRRPRSRRSRGPRPRAGWTRRG